MSTTYFFEPLDLFCIDVINFYVYIFILNNDDYFGFILSFIIVPGWCFTIADFLSNFSITLLLIITTIFANVPGDIVKTFYNIQ